MQKKSIDINIGVDDFNKKLFAKSVQLISTSRRIPIHEVSALHRESDVRKNYAAIEEKVHNILKIMRNFTETEKPTFNNPIDLALQILEEVKLQVDIKIRKQKEEKNTVKLIKSEIQAHSRRPQDLYPIKPYENFDPHYHQSYLQDGQIMEVKPCQQVFQPSQNSAPFVYVDTVEKLDQAIKEMKEFGEIAVDVEHSNKSYQGFTCLIQISTRTKDYIIDVFPIWNCVGALQEIIGNPNIIKVMHGADMDTKWLQRDFNIHIINLFDTHKASRVLGKQKFSYAFLLHHYCGASTNKALQLADWRTRPLSAQMLAYARTDTHYLLTIFDYIRMDLQKQASPMGLSVRSILGDLQRSSHEVTLCNVQPTSFRTNLQYATNLLHFKDRQQLKVVENIFQEIDFVARKLDQSFQDIVPKNQLGAALSVVKDITFNRSSKASKEARIQRVLSHLKKNPHPEVQQAIQNIKNTMLEVFCKQATTQPEKIIQAQPLILSLGEKPAPQSVSMIGSLSTNSFVRNKTQIAFTELSYKSFDTNNLGIKISFKPIASFLAGKYGIEEKKEEQSDGVMQQEEEEDEEEEDQPHVDPKPMEQPQDTGRIEFKRMNPNVVYTVEDQDPEVANALKSQMPRKARRQTDYEQRIRNKKGNVYDLLGE